MLNETAKCTKGKEMVVISIVHLWNKWLQVDDPNICGTCNIFAVCTSRRCCSLCNVQNAGFTVMHQLLRSLIMG